MNKVIVMGNLSKDIEIRYSNNGKNTAIANFAIAIPRKFKSEGAPSADFFNCTAFGKTAEFAEKYLKKGSKVVITGQIQNNNYKNKDGNTVYSNVIVVEEIDFAGKKDDAEETSNDAPKNPQQNDTAFMNINNDESELPFN